MAPGSYAVTCINVTRTRAIFKLTKFSSYGILFQQCKVHALQEFDQCAMDCLNSWQCIDACYKTGLLETFSKCDCFGENPNLDNDKDGHLTLLADNNQKPYNIAYVTDVNGGFQEKFEIVY